MKVVVDRDVCQEHGQCVFAAPEIFELDADGHLIYREDVDESQRDAVEDSVDVCPVQAITIED